jgi:hypothetical protein
MRMRYFLCSALAILAFRTAIAQVEVRTRSGSFEITGKPPILSFEASFVEPSGNRFLDAGETATIKLAIKNNGAGLARNVLARFASTLEIPGVVFDREIPVGNVLPGESKFATLSVSAEETVKNQKVSLRIDVLEGSGYDADAVTMMFETRETSVPQLKIVQFAIDDDTEGESQGNNNGKMERGETVEVVAILQNIGSGEARDVSVDISLKDEGRNLFFQSLSRTVRIGNMSPEHSERVSFAISTNKRYAGDTVQVALLIREKRPQYSVREYLNLELNKQQRSLQEIVVAGAERKQETGTITVAPSLVPDADEVPFAATPKHDGIAVVIGNSTYDNKDVPPVEYAVRDATKMREYLEKTLGFKEENVIYQENASKAAFERIFGLSTDFRGMLFNYVGNRKVDVFVYYSGHGAPDVQSKEGYIVPKDCDPMYVRINGYSLSTLYANLDRLQAKSIVVVIDACFSGVSAGGSLLKFASPIFVKIENPRMSSRNASIFSASGADEISSWYPEKKHGLFTYFFLKALKGEGDTDRDGNVSLGEIQKYVSENVRYVSRRFNRMQTPQIIVEDPRKIVVEYRR